MMEEDPDQSDKAYLSPLSNRVSPGQGEQRGIQLGTSSSHGIEELKRGGGRKEMKKVPNARTHTRRNREKSDYYD